MLLQNKAEDALIARVCPAGGWLGRGGRGRLPALQLRALPGAGADLPAVRSRADLLQWRLRGAVPARDAAAGRGACWRT